MVTSETETWRFLVREHNAESVLVYMWGHAWNRMGGSTPRPLNNITQIARFMGPTWDPPGDDSTQVGPMLAPWTLLSGYIASSLQIFFLQDWKYRAVPLQHGHFSFMSKTLIYVLPQLLQCSMQYHVILDHVAMAPGCTEILTRCQQASTDSNNGFSVKCQAITWTTDDCKLWRQSNYTKIVLSALIIDKSPLD